MPVFNDDGTITIHDQVKEGNLVYYVLGFERKRDWFKLKDKVRLFSYLLKNKYLDNWKKLYHKTADELIKAGYLDRDGNIRDDKFKTGGEAIVIQSNN